MFDLLVDNTYIQFGASLWYQICGIPMGISPAVFIANMYLWFYEFQFLSRLVAVLQQTLPGGGDFGCQHLKQTNKQTKI